ncbi:hypothetical protein D3C78_1317320 [compost metagenome]
MVTKAKASTMPMDRIGQRSSTRVSRRVLRPVLMSMRRISIEISAEKKIAVPVAETGSSLNTAGMAVALATIGAVFITNWSRCGMAK